MYKYKNLPVGQLLQQHLSFLKNLLNLIITKYLTPAVDDNLSVCMDDCSSYNLSISEDIKISQVYDEAFL